jgi:hypothetical protein
VNFALLSSAALTRVAHSHPGNANLRIGGLQRFRVPAPSAPLNAVSVSLPPNFEVCVIPLGPSETFDFSWSTHLCSTLFPSASFVPLPAVAGGRPAALFSAFRNFQLFTVDCGPLVPESTLSFSVDYGLFGIFKNINSFVIMQIRTLSQKHPGGGYERARSFLGSASLGVLGASSP